MDTNILKIPCFAKLNLSLFVESKRQDGYHNLFSLFHFIDLHDELRISANNELIVRIAVDSEIQDINLLKQTDNLVYKAADALNKYTNRSNTASIEICKRIPTGAGLGGGSSDAASTLLALNNYWNLNLSMPELLHIANYLGADVPFFLLQKNAFVMGKGEIIEPVDFIINGYYLLVYPNINISTKDAYNMLKLTIPSDIEQEKIINRRNEIKELWLNLATENIFTLANELLPQRNFQDIFCNSFEETIFAEYPEIADLKVKLTKLSNGIATMTGSGSACFAIFETQNKALEATKNFIGAGYKIFVGEMK